MTFSRALAFSSAGAVLALGLSGLVATPAAAMGLLGRELEVAYYTPDTATVYGGAAFTPDSFVVGLGQETDGNVEDVTHLLVDFDEDSLHIELHTILSNPTWGNTAFNGMIFTVALPLDIETATVDGSTTMSGFDNSRVSFTDHEILVNWAGLSYADGTRVNINFTFGAPVPEPGSGLLVGCGLLGLAYFRRARA
jgi:hypothetical protein